MPRAIDSTGAGAWDAPFDQRGLVMLRLLFFLGLLVLGAASPAMHSLGS